ncbi:hydroxymethylbilane synthase [Rhodocyclus tenuis]|uniref:hydroxymethylbilane synthase n=1 Tax=Rhodocyclus tenuis TaxID=1066 RepID=UPI001C85F9D8|nr:hydroxymethylbilane synthase [Rhodocyclus tenuis]
MAGSLIVLRFQSGKTAAPSAGKASPLPAGETLPAGVVESRAHCGLLPRFRRTYRELALDSSTSTPSRIVIASRESRLAMWQAVHVQGRLAALYPQSQVEILGMTTQGDQILDKPLATIGGKGLFIKELEVAMQEGRADLAVHSLKDVPMVMPEGFVLAAISERETPFDAFVSNKYAALDDLPAGAIVGTSSLRRESVLRARYPQLVIKSLRGNLDTRLKKLDAGEYDAIILAAAGLIRLGLKDRVRSVLTPEQSLPAPGQGALGIEIPADRPDAAAIVATLNDPDTAHCVRAERAFSRALGGSCQVPLGGYAIIDNGQLWLRGFVATPDGKQMVCAELRGARADDEAIGLKLAAMLREQGADAILAQLATHTATQ